MFPPFTQGRNVALQQLAVPSIFTISINFCKILRQFHDPSLQFFYVFADVRDLPLTFVFESRVQFGRDIGRFDSFGNGKGHLFRISYGRKRFRRTVATPRTSSEGKRLPNGLSTRFEEPKHRGLRIQDEDVGRTSGQCNDQQEHLRAFF